MLTTLSLQCKPKELDAHPHALLCSANCSRIHHVFSDYLIRSRNCDGNPDPCTWIPALSESCMISSCEPYTTLLTDLLISILSTKRKIRSSLLWPVLQRTLLLVPRFWRSSAYFTTLLRILQQVSCMSLTSLLTTLFLTHEI